MYILSPTDVELSQNTNRGTTPPDVYPANSTATFISNFLWTNISGTINNIQQVGLYFAYPTSLADRY